jgi:hypothetical protein
MIDTILVSLAVTAGIVALGGVPLRCWQFYTGYFRSRIPQHSLARATFSLFAVLFLVLNAAAWIYALFVSYRDFSCAGSCSNAGVASAIAVGLLGCAYALLEGFLLTSRRRVRTADPRHAAGGG